MKTQHENVRLRGALFLILPLVAAGCYDDESEGTVMEDYPATGTEVPDAGSTEGAMVSWEALRAYGFERRDELQEQLNVRLDRLQDDVDDLAREAGEDLQGLSTVQDDLRQRAQDLEERVEQLGEASAETWSTMKAETIDALSTLERSLEDARRNMGR